MLHKILFITFVLTSNLLFSQGKYQRLFKKTVEHQPQTGVDGIYATIRITVRYDALMGEPTVAAVAKVKLGNRIVRNGKPYSKEDFSEKAWNSLEFGLINVQASLYSGSRKVSEVPYYNLISIDMPISPNWDELWPGVSEAEAKNLYKKGYDLRDFKLVGDISYYWGRVDMEIAAKEKQIKFESTIKSADELLNKEDYEQAKQKYLKAKALNTKSDYPQQQIKRIDEILEQKEEEQNKANLEMASEGLDEIASDEDSDTEYSNYNNQDVSNSLNQKSIEQKEYEAKMERKREYEERVAEQTQTNQNIAAASAAASAGTLVMIGQLIYDGMGTVNPNNIFMENQLYGSFDIGYSSSIIPVIYNSHREYYDYVGDLVVEKESDNLSAFTINLDLRLSGGYEGKYYGGEVFLQAQPGFNIVFDAFNLSYRWGGSIFGGLPNSKIFLSINRGRRNFWKNNWISADEFAGGSKISFRSSQFTWGYRLTAKGYQSIRNHFFFGFVTERIKEGFANEGEGEFMAYFYNTKQANNPTGEISDNLMKGFFFEWQKEHNFRLYASVFPNYAIAGTQLYPQSDDFAERQTGGLFIEVGFIRQMKGFLPPNFN